MSPKANEFVSSTSEPPSWLIELCNSPLGRSLFLYILKDPSLRDRLYSGDYNGLIDFFVSTLILNSSTLYSDIKGISLSNCTLSTSLLLYERVLREIAMCSSYHDCETLISSFVEQFTFTTAEELCIFLNYTMEIQNAVTNENVKVILATLSERVFMKARGIKPLSPVSLTLICEVDVIESVLRRNIVE